MTNSRNPNDTSAQDTLGLPKGLPQSALGGRDMLVISGRSAATVMRLGRDITAISDILCKNLPLGLVWDKSYYMELAIDMNSQRTPSVKRRTTLAWPSPISL